MRYTAPVVVVAAVAAAITAAYSCFISAYNHYNSMHTLLHTTHTTHTQQQFAKLAMSFGGKDLPIKHIPGPEGVRGRNSDNTMIKAKLNWAPSIPIEVGLRKTYAWIKEQIEAEQAASGGDSASAASKYVMHCSAAKRAVAVLPAVE
eukprot:11971-Heterococcus_DN1.PRE.1